jgi:lipopolysaccharide/colanic/teichoic acid biosynthesis glycosyltransferase
MSGHAITGRKRIFDLVICGAAAVLWVPVIIVCGLVNWLVEGRPIFYISDRRVSGGRTIRVIKFRTMVRGAAKIANRSTIPIHRTRFLNMPHDSPLYTRLGRIFEACSLTEIPQLLHVVRGDMSLIGNRPLPEDEIRALAEVYPGVEDRFRTPAGLTGPVQLIGRDVLTDDDRLAIESAYCRACLEGYSWRLDAALLLLTVLIATRMRRRMSLEDVIGLIARYRGSHRSIYLRDVKNGESHPGAIRPVHIRSESN